VTNARITQRPTPRGSRGDLRAIAQWLHPDGAPRRGWGWLIGTLHGVAIHLLVESQYATDRRTVVAERERYDEIALLSRKLRFALQGRAVAGTLLAPLMRLGGGSAPRSNLDSAYAICWRWGDDDEHPLHFIEQVAKDAAASLAPVARKGGASLHAETRGHPQRALALACGALLYDLLGELPSISESGQLALLMARVWEYATGLNAPASLGYHAKEAARELRSKARVPIDESRAKSRPKAPRRQEPRLLQGTVSDMRMPCKMKLPPTSRSWPKKPRLKSD
jgi:hypothetical protein